MITHEWTVKTNGGKIEPCWTDHNTDNQWNKVFNAENAKMKGYILRIDNGKKPFWSYDDYHMMLERIVFFVSVELPSSPLSIHVIASELLNKLKQYGT